MEGIAAVKSFKHGHIVGGGRAAGNAGYRNSHISA